MTTLTEIQTHDPNWSQERDILDYLTISCGLRISEAREFIAEAQARLVAALLARDTEETSALLVSAAVSRKPPGFSASDGAVRIS